MNQTIVEFVGKDHATGEAVFAHLDSSFMTSENWRNVTVSGIRGIKTCKAEISK